MNEFKRAYGKVRDISPEDLRKAFAAIDGIGVAVLFGSRARVEKVPPNSRSDYDFAVSMDKSAPASWGHLAQARLAIGQSLQLADCDFDLVDLQIAPAGIKMSIKAGFLLLKGSEDELRHYLDSTRQIAGSEKEVLDFLHEKVTQTGTLDKIEIRAARASIQIIIENAIGKARRTLKHYNCPLVPSRARDALVIMYDTGLLSDETYQSLMAAVGFRNAMIHDYMNFDENVLLSILRDKRYLDLHEFLVEVPNYGPVQLKRVESYTV